MNNSIDRITLDVRKAVSQTVLYWKRGDTARTIEAVLTENGKPYVLKDCTVVFTAPKADGLILFNDCEIKDNRIIYHATTGTTDTIGSLLCEFRVIGNNGKVLTAPRFTINVENTVVDPNAEIADEPEVGALDALIGEASALIDDVTEKLENGEFNGKDGKDGVDGKDGAPGKDGNDGKDGAPGADGKDGISVSHEWNGTVLTITSASGTSSADLKGPPGEPGSGDSDIFDDLPPIAALQMADSFIIYDEPDKTMARMTWNRLRDLILGYVNSNISVYELVDENTGFTARLPALSDDAVLALASDIADALVDYYTKGETYTREEIDSRISAIPKFDIEVVDKLPTSDISTTTIYLVVTKEDEDNLYTEYIYVNGEWEILGTQRMDLSGYALKEEIPSKLSELSGDSDHRTVTDAEKVAWNNKSDFSGNYADLAGKPTIPTVPTNVSAFNNDVGYANEEYVQNYAQPKGDYALRSDIPDVPVQSVNGKTGTVQLVPGDIGAQPAGDYALASQIPSVPIQSVNGKTGAVQLTADDVGAQPKGNYQPAGSYVSANDTITITGVDENGVTHTWTVYGKVVS